LVEGLGQWKGRAHSGQIHHAENQVSLVTLIKMALHMILLIMLISSESYTYLLQLEMTSLTVRRLFPTTNLNNNVRSVLILNKDLKNRSSFCDRRICATNQINHRKQNP